MTVNESYKSAGVNLDAGYRAVELMKPHVARTLTKGVASGLGGFGGLFVPDISGMKEPVLVSGTDGVGTKLKLAFELDKHDTVGIDCVAMSVNDVICCGAKPLFFLDYIAVGKNVPERVAAVVSGVAEGCVRAGCALIGGETAEMPGFYPEDEYDLAGFCVGLVDREKIIDHSTMKKGDVVLGMKSSGPHSNGYSLIRRSLSGRDLRAYSADLGMTLGEALLAPTNIYVKPALAAMAKVTVKGVSHITGGGFFENVPRSLKDGLTARICKDKLQTPPVFDVIRAAGGVPERDMYNTFNMGVGMTLVVSPEDADQALAALGEGAMVIGDIIEGAEGAILC